MARYVRRNPEFLGEDMMTVAWQALGLGAAGAVNDKIMAPILSRVMPGNYSGGAVGKVIDAVSTALAAWALGVGVGFASRDVGRKMKHGGFILAGGKFLSAFIPGYGLSSNFPAIPLPSFGARALPPAPVAAPNGAAALTRLGIGKMGL